MSNNQAGTADCRVMPGVAGDRDNLLDTPYLSTTTTTRA